MNRGTPYYLLYLGARKIVRATGLIGPLRRYAGPLLGRFFVKNMGGQNHPLDVNGHKMFLSVGDSYPPIDMARGKYEEGTTRLLESLIRPGMVFMDVGAHVGYFTLLAARQTGPEGKVYAFEPEPGNYGLLARNVELNGYRNVATTNKALCNQIGTSTLYVTALDSGRHSMYRHDIPEKDSVEVETTTMDAFLDSEGWPTVDMIKMDVEGAELEVLAGMSQLLQRSERLNLVMEFNPLLLRSAGVDPLEFLDRTLSWGFDVNCIDEKTGPHPLANDDRTQLVNKLIASQRAVNLWCSKQ